MTTKIQNLLNEYKADPNCRPADWIKSENVTLAEHAWFMAQATVDPRVAGAALRSIGFSVASLDDQSIISYYHQFKSTGKL